MAELKRDRQLYLRLLSYAVPYWRLFLIAIFGMVVLALTEPAIPALLKPMLDGAFIEQDPKMIRWIPILFIGLFLIKGLAAYTSGAALHSVANRVILDLRQQMYDRLLICPLPFFDDHNAGALVSKFTYDVMQIKEATTNAVTVLVRDSLSVLGLLGWMFYINWKLSLIALISGPFIIVIVIIIRKRLRKMSRRVQSSMADINHALNETIQGIKVIKLHDAYQQSQTRFFNIINSNRRFTMKFAMAAVASSPSVQLITAIFLSIIIYIASNQAASGNLTVGEFVSFTGAMAMLLGPLKRLVGLNEYIQRGLAASESVFALIDEAVEMNADSQSNNTENLQRLTGNFRFENLSFSYDGTEGTALRNLSFNIGAGETVALVGASGAGKTTLINLIAGFYPVDRGMYFIDDKDVSDIELAVLRNNIALVSQDIVLFNDSIRNNIAFGRLSGTSDDEIKRVAEQAHALEFIQDMPEGFDTIIGERGLKLSGGQRQRIAIARALLKDAPILILDEATSSLDTISEKQIQAALEDARKGRTCIVIAHRLSTVENADRLLVMQSGELVETGTHTELLEKQGVYAKLYQMQFSA